MKSFSLPPLSKLVETPRSQAINSIVEHYHKECNLKKSKNSKTNKKTRERSNSSK
jgi:hypothetical protein